MSVHNFNVHVGDQVFLDASEEEVGAVRQVARDHLIVYIEGAGDFEVRGPSVMAAHDGKLVLDPAKLEAKLLEAAQRAHESETE